MHLANKKRISIFFFWKTHIHFYVGLAFKPFFKIHQIYRRINLKTILLQEVKSVKSKLLSQKRIMRIAIWWWRRLIDSSDWHNESAISSRWFVSSTFGDYKPLNADGLKKFFDFEVKEKDGLKEDYKKTCRVLY